MINRFRMGINMRKSIVLCVITNIMFLTGCGRILDMPVGIQETMQMGVVSDEDYPYEVTRNDYNTLETDAIEISLDNLIESVEGVYTYDGEHLTISAAGDYILTGDMDSGNLIVNAYDDEVVHLFLNNVEISSGNGFAIYVENAGKVIITLMEGTENILSDGHAYTEMQKACIFSNADLTINGNGKLYIYGYYADGVRSKDRLKLINTNIYVKSKKDGLRGNDAVILLDSITEIECEGTGILSNSDDDMVILQGGSCKIIAGQNAISSNRYVSVHDCLTDLYSILETVKCSGHLDISEY